MAKPIFWVWFLTLSLASWAQAAEFRSVQEIGCVLYDAPSTQSTKRFVVGVGYPFEVLVKLDRWIKVRDQNGDISWTEARNLSEKRILVVTIEGAEVREKPSPDGVPIFRAGKGLLLELVDASTPEWTKVRHRDGQVGYINSKQVWGL